MAEVQTLVRQRVCAAEARLDFWRWDGFLFLPRLVQLGKARLVWLTGLILVADLALTVAFRSWPIALVGLGLVIAIEIYENAQIEVWVAAHNARLDARIRTLLDSADG